jgi:hypothetical protein
MAPVGAVARGRTVSDDLTHFYGDDCDPPHWLADARAALWDALDDAEEPLMDAPLWEDDDGL